MAEITEMEETTGTTKITDIAKTVDIVKTTNIAKTTDIKVLSKKDIVSKEINKKNTENTKSAGKKGGKHKKSTKKKLTAKEKKRLAEKRELAAQIIAQLKEAYPEAGCTLDYNQAWKLLVSVRLAAQCTDARVNVVVEGLYEKYPSVAALAAADAEDIERIVKPCGLGHSKARDISACMKILHEKYNGQVPDDFDELLQLPGVGRKSANLIMGDVFGKPAIVTDTHCIRLTNRMGLVDGIKEPKKVEMALWDIIPPQEGSDFCHRLVYHGREICTARTKPYCDRCCIKDICMKNL